MRKCCCCISVHVGSAILGFIGLVICALELVVLIPYIFQVDKEVFNPIEEYKDPWTKAIEEWLKQDLNATQQQTDMLRKYTEEYMWPSCVGFAIEAGVYWLCCLLMMIGALCQIRGLMIPYLLAQMLCIVVMVMSMVAVTVALFIFTNLDDYDLIYGIVASVVTLVISAFLFYFWAAVQRAFVELGNNDYMYSPAPIKPVGVGHYDGRGHADHYPTSPQHFPMDERH